MHLFDIIAPVIVTALFGASAVALHVYCILPALRWHRASRLAKLIAALAAAAVPVGVAAELVFPAPRYIVAVAMFALIAIWTFPSALVWLTGGRRPIPAELAGVLDVIDRIASRMDVGDVESARELLAELEVKRTPATSRYVDLWSRYVEEELARRAGYRTSSLQTRAEIAEEYRALVIGHPPRLWIALPAIALAGVTAAVPGVVAARACIGVELMLLQSTSTTSEHRDLAHALPQQSEPGARLVFDASLDLEAAVEAKTDPETRRQLTEAGFVAGYARDWVASDGRPASTEVLEFANPAGAVAYQSAVNRFACRFSIEAFDGPAGGFGLQTRWGRGDPFSEQISWISGNHRYIVSIRFLEPPEDHARIIALAESALDAARSSVQEKGTAP